MRSLLLLFVLTLPVFGQGIFTNMENKPWTTCVLPNCNPGGKGVPTKIINMQSQNLAFYGDLQLGLSGPAYTNALFWQKVGPTNLNSFQSEADIYVTEEDVQYAQALEFDIFAFNAPFEFMFGSECVNGGKWQIWDELHGTWINTTLNCSLSKGWHHIQWFVHRVDNDYSCQGYPCEHYDVLGVDHQYTTFNLTEPAGPIPDGWSNDSGLNIQLDESSLGKSLLEYVSHINLIEE